MLQSASTNQTSRPVFQHQSGSNINRISRIRLMLTNQITQPSFLEQVTNLAPSVSAFINSKHARLTAAVISHDVTGGYGRGFTFNLKLELLIQQCLNCCETEYSQPSFDCRWHRFETRFMQIADAEAPTLERALLKLERAASYKRPERMAA